MTTLMICESCGGHCVPLEFGPSDDVWPNICPTSGIHPHYFNGPHPTADGEIEPEPRTKAGRSLLAALPSTNEWDDPRFARMVARLVREVEEEAGATTHLLGGVAGTKPPPPPPPDRG